MKLIKRTEQEVMNDLETRSEMIRLKNELSAFYQEYRNKKIDLISQINNIKVEVCKIYNDVVASKLGSKRTEIKLDEADSKKIEALTDTSWYSFKSIVIGGGSGVGLKNSYRDNADYQQGYSYLGILFELFNDKIYACLSDKGKDYLERFMRYYVSNSTEQAKLDNRHLEIVDVPLSLKESVFSNRDTSSNYYYGREAKEFKEVKNYPLVMESDDYHFCRLVLCSNTEDFRKSQKHDSFSNLDEIENEWKSICSWIAFKEKIMAFKEEEVKKMEARVLELKGLLSGLTNEFKSDLMIIALKESGK